MSQTVNGSVIRYFRYRIEWRYWEHTSSEVKRRKLPRKRRDIAISKCRNNENIQGKVDSWYGHTAGQI